MYGRADSTSSRIRAAFSGRLSSSTSTSSDDHESPQTNVFAPLEEVWEALEEWFLLLLSEMEDIEGEAGVDDCVLLDDGIGIVLFFPYLYFSAIVQRYKLGSARCRWDICRWNS